ncbi:MAG TPA: hypothetical protein VHT03_02100 [Rhizomicrobium sp.]|jgi:hypothetical protein|nr:hypothetical protein [Rhizomicrobium sp.]
MQRNLLENIAAWIVFGAGLCAVTPALAMDPACQAPLAVQTDLRNRPFHMYITSEMKFSGGRLSAAAASIGVAGARKSEEIWTGKDVYVLNNGRWIEMNTSFAEMQKDATDDPDSRKAREAERCAALPDETVYGQSAAVYRMHTHNLERDVDTKIWVSKSSRLLLKSEFTTNAGSTKNFATSRYEYTGVQAPANAISLREMLKKK